MKFVFIRHGHYAKPPTGPNDGAPLTEHGRQSARLAGEFLKQQGTALDLIVTTKKRRTQETATLVLEALGSAPARIDNDAGFASADAMASKLAAWVERSGRPVETVALVGSVNTQAFCLRALGKAEVPDDNRGVVLIYDQGAGGTWSLVAQHAGTPKG